MTNEINLLNFDRISGLLSIASARARNNNGRHFVFCIGSQLSQYWLPWFIILLLIEFDVRNIVGFHNYVLISVLHTITARIRQVDYYGGRLQRCNN